MLAAVANKFNVVAETWRLGNAKYSNSWVTAGDLILRLWVLICCCNSLHAFQRFDARASVKLDTRQSTCGASCCARSTKLLFTYYFLFLTVSCCCSVSFRQQKHLVMLRKLSHINNITRLFFWFNQNLRSPDLGSAWSRFQLYKHGFYIIPQQINGGFYSGPRLIFHPRFVEICSVVFV